MSTKRPRYHLAVGARVIVLARTPEPPGVTSNLGHPCEPAVIGICLTEAEPVVVISEGSGHLGAGGAFRIDEVLDRAGRLRSTWCSLFERADALWTVPLLGRHAGGDPLTEDHVVEAYRSRHGTSPAVIPDGGE